MGLSQQGIQYSNFVFLIFTHFSQELKTNYCKVDHFLREDTNQYANLMPIYIFPLSLSLKEKTHKTCLMVFFFHTVVNVV